MKTLYHFLMTLTSEGDYLKTELLPVYSSLSPISVKGPYTWSLKAKAQTLRLGTTNASLKLKGIDGESSQLWII